MAIKIVMGPSCAGKSHFIKETFPNSTKIDLWDYQENLKSFSVDEIMKTYIETKDALVEAIKEGKDVVLEHTLLKAIRREMYVKAIREVTDEPINIYVLIPSLEDYLYFCNQRKLPASKTEYKNMMEILEIPTFEEGFKNIYVVTPKRKNTETN